jgi:protein-L-isoaspartate(D-aspartate) O-methyltransferase
MIDEAITQRGVRNPAVLRAIRLTPRDMFLPPELREHASRDVALPIGYGATISQPSIVALMTELLRPEPHHRILEIGTGSGYQAAILSLLVNEVDTIEVVPELARRASNSLERLRRYNVTVRTGDGYEGWPERMPFDGIILTAAPPQIPPLLFEQLAVAGTMVAPVGEGDHQELVVFEKDARGLIHSRSILPVVFVPMRSPLPISE